jgi:small subunit ribosomal protein S1
MHMSNHVQRHETAPPPALEEGYWSALLGEGEFAESPMPRHDNEPDANHRHNGHNGHSAPPPAFHSNGNGANPSGGIWTEIKQLMDDDIVLELKVIGYNRGGLLVEWNDLHGFVPASQLNDFPASNNPNVRRNALMDWVGRSLHLRVIEINAEHNRLILSERAAQVEVGGRADMLRRIKQEDVLEGVVTNLCDFGAFIDLGGLEGLIHISELSWGRVGHPEDVLQRGEQVQVYVLSIDREAARVALSIKRLHPDPWATVGERYTIGQTVEGIITNVVDFGAFACIEDGLEGLIHVSELAEGHFLHPRNVVQEGDRISARVLTIDSRARRLGLSLRLSE